MVNEMGTGGQEWVKQFTNGFRVVGLFAELVVYPIQNRADPEVGPPSLMTNLKWRAQAKRAAVTDPNDGAPWEDALDQVDRGWLQGPFPFDEDGSLVTGEGPQLAKPASRARN